MSTPDTPEKYNKIQIALHGITALTVIGLLLMGNLVLENLSNEHFLKPYALQAHMLFGGVAIVLTLIRIAWRKVSKQPAPLVTDKPWMDIAAQKAHIALNLLVLITATTGLIFSLIAGLPEILFFAGGELPASFEGAISRSIHGFCADVLLVLIIVHALAALYHQFVLKDGIMNRMSLKK